MLWLRQRRSRQSEQVNGNFVSETLVLADHRLTEALEQTPQPTRIAVLVSGHKPSAAPN
jgi:hypothetical protein